MAEHAPKVSVICAWYNRADFIQGTVDSILGQDLDSFEMILINDGSPDPRVREILDTYSDPRLRVIHQENRGLTPTLSRAVRESRGEFIAVQGAGDVSLQGRLRKLYEVLAAHPGNVGAACGRENVVVGGAHDGETTPVIPKSESIDRTRLLAASSSPFSHGEVMFRRDAYDRAGGYRDVFRMAQDRDLWLRMSRFGSFSIVPDNLYRRFVFTSDGIKGNLGRTIAQIKYSQMARQCAIEWDKWGVDIVEIFGPDAALFRKPDRYAADQLAKAATKYLQAGLSLDALLLAHLALRERIGILPLASVVLAYLYKTSFTRSLATWIVGRLGITDPSVPAPLIAAREQRRLTMVTDQQGAVAGNKTEAAPLLCLLDGGEGYGVRRAWRGILGELQARGRAFRVTAIADGPFVTELRPKHSVSVLGRAMPTVRGGGAQKLRALANRVFSQATVARALTREIRRTGAKSLLFRSPLEVPLAGLAARLSGIPAYWLMPNSVSDGYPLDFNRRLYRFAFRHLNVTPIGNSTYTIGTLGKGDFPHHVVHLGVDPDEFAPRPAGNMQRSELNIPSDATVLGVFARLVPEKGQLEFVNAMAALGSAGANIHLLFCGGPLDTPFAAELVRRATELNVAGRVHMPGPISDTRPYYAACDIVVNSRIDPEPFGLSIIEAMMMGKPVFAHAAGGPSETIVDGETGWLIEDARPVSFETGLRRVLRDRNRWGEMGAAAHARASNLYTTAAMVDRLVGVLGSPAAAAPNPRAAQR